MIEEIVTFIQTYASEHLFDKVQNRNIFYDEWKPEWLQSIGQVSSNVRASLALNEIQNAVIQEFKVENVRSEEGVVATNGSLNNFRLDLFIPSERVAIEICFGAVKNEFEKDILKAMLDHRVNKLYIIARDYLTGGALYGIRTMQQTGNQSIIDMVSNNLEVVPTQLCPQII